jgi:cystathionine beta-lyase/cystathionine gamma-synthase
VSVLATHIARPVALDRDAIFKRAAGILAVDQHLFGDAVVPPIFQTSLFTFPDFASLERAFAGDPSRPIYSRGNNPTVQAFEEKVAALEFAEAARGFSSGMGAISASILAFVQSGERIVCVDNIYGDSLRMFERLFHRLNITVDYVDATDADAVIAKLDGAKLLYLENPTSFLFHTQEIRRLADAARERGLISLIDNSWATPLFQQPLLHGCDLVMHSASKYLGGHSDTVAGVVAGPRALIDQINALTYPFLGAKLSPLEGFLLVRGMRSLALRLVQHEANGLHLARQLQAHPSVARIFHPAFSNHPGCQTLLGTSGLFSFEATGEIDIPSFVNALKSFRIGVSWGGHESLVIPAAASFKREGAENSIARFGVPRQTVRLHAGLEDPDELWADLAQALAAARRPQ